MATECHRYYSRSLFLTPVEVEFILSLVGVKYFLTPIEDNLHLTPTGVRMISSLKHLHEIKMKVTSPSLLASAIRDQRKLSKLSQQETAAQIGIKQTTVSDFENRPESTKLDTLFKILAALDLELHVVKRGLTLNEDKTWNKEW